MGAGVAGLAAIQLAKKKGMESIYHTYIYHCMRIVRFNKIDDNDGVNVICYCSSSVCNL